MTSPTNHAELIHVAYRLKEASERPLTDAMLTECREHGVALACLVDG